MSSQIDPGEFLAALQAQQVDLFAGVPDSLLQDFARQIEAEVVKDRNFVTANEGNAVALAAGYHVATGRYGAVYLQNSGLGNTVNPLLSLADPQVYSIPMLLLIGWRGEPGVPDEPQHVTQGRLTFPLLEALEVPAVALGPVRWQEQLSLALEQMVAQSRPVALVVRKGVFSAGPELQRHQTATLTREQVLEAITAAIGPDAFVVSTTGKTSRELFEIRESRREGHSRDFLTVGSMGHASSIALGMSLGTTAPVYCIDGDGAMLMHLGALTNFATEGPDNLRYVVINNGAHESVGGQATIASQLDLVSLLSACGFGAVEMVNDATELPAALNRLVNTDKAALVVDVAQGSRPDLGRPTATPIQNKAAMMAAFNAV